MNALRSLAAALPLLLLVPIGPFLAWKRGDAGLALRRSISGCIPVHLQADTFAKTQNLTIRRATLDVL